MKLSGIDFALSDAWVYALLSSDVNSVTVRQFMAIPTEDSTWLFA